MLRIVRRGRAITMLMVGALSALASSAHAAGNIAGWNIVAESSVATGYDSNINLAEEADGDLFLNLEQKGTARRERGTLLLQVDGGIIGQVFADHADANSIDGGLSFKADYPNGLDGTVSGWSAAATWRTSTLPRPDTERRFRQSVHSASFDRTWMFSPKTGFSGSVGLSGYAYSDADYRDSDSAQLNLGWTHERSSLLRFDTGYWFEFERARGLGSARDTRLLAHTVGFRARGELLPKLSGSVFAGLRMARFNGGLSTDDLGPSLNADLTWIASPRLTAQLTARHDVTFSPEGEAATLTSLRARLAQSIRPGFKVVANIAPTWGDYTGVIRDRRTTRWAWGAAIEYERTKRFSAMLAFDWQDNDSTDRNYIFRQMALNLQTTWRY